MNDIGYVPNQPWQRNNKIENAIPPAKKAKNK